jgi:uroporphyrinogen decarboxylase
VDKPERLQRTIAGESVDRPPAVLWRHWPGDDQRASDLVRALLSYQERFDWDFLVVSASNLANVVDYGVRDAWVGNVYGRREVIRWPIARSLDWTEIRPLDPTRGHLAVTVEVIRQVLDRLPAATPVVVPLLSPLSQAGLLAPADLLAQHLRLRHDRLASGLGALAEGTLRFIDHIRRLPIAGVLYQTDHADYQRLSTSEYSETALDLDRRILESLPEHWWLNGVQLRGRAPMFDLFADLPVQMMQWDVVRGEPGIPEGKARFPGAVLGGFSADEHVHVGSPAMIRDRVREVLYAASARRVILSAEHEVPATSAESNLLALK